MTMILSNDDVERFLTMPVCLEAMEIAYRELGEGRAVNIPRADMLVPTETEGRYHAFKTMSGSIPKLKVTALRINTDVIHWPQGSADGQLRVKIPAGQGQKWGGLVEVFDTETGELLAIIPDGFIQKMRVGASSGLAARYMARQDASAIGILGSGWQAGAQLEAMCSVREIKQIKVFSPTAANRIRFADEMSSRLRVEVTPVLTAEDAVKGTHIVIAATNSLTAVIKGEWLEKGMHITTVRSLSEVDELTVRRCDCIVVNDHHLTDAYIVPGHESKVPEFATGDYRHDELVDEIMNWQSRPVLANVVAGKFDPRSSIEDITCFLNNPGLGIQFAAAAARVLESSRKNNVGREIPTDWFLQSVHP
jgi:ornithine cyclodeaminase/alanine dehydrogenase-like protein (mu-crystallin family)